MLAIAHLGVKFIRDLNNPSEAYHIHGWHAVSIWEKVCELGYEKEFEGFFTRAWQGGDVRDGDLAVGIFRKEGDTKPILGFIIEEGGWVAVSSAQFSPELAALYPIPAPRK